jgi:suppressor of tumorigenicity protein 13
VVEESDEEMEKEESQGEPEVEEEEEEEEIIESDVELEGETVEPDNDPPQKVFFFFKNYHTAWCVLVAF